MNIIKFKIAQQIIAKLQSSQEALSLEDMSEGPTSLHEETILELVREQDTIEEIHGKYQLR